MKAYKVFKPDWTCRGFQYKVGETYELKGELELCKFGFHACRKAVDCFSYYTFDKKNKVAEVEMLGEIVGLDSDKQATNKIRIIKEISWHEVLGLVNTGKWNSGYGNTGDKNSGYGNSGYKNSGYRNSGYRNTGNGNTGNGNTGNWNSGYKNTGDENSGYRNSGNKNTGNRNSGDENSGSFNACDFETGFFNPASSPVEKVRVFGKTYVNRDDFIESEGYRICCRMVPIFYRKDGEQHAMPYKHWWDVWASGLSKEEKQKVKEMIGFDAEVFYEITGLDWR